MAKLQPRLGVNAYEYGQPWVAQLVTSLTRHSGDTTISWVKVGSRYYGVAVRCQTSRLRIIRTHVR